MELLKNYKVDNINDIPREAIVIGYSETYFVTLMKTQDNHILWVNHGDDEATYSVDEFKEVPNHLFDIYFSILLTNKFNSGSL